MNPLLELMAGGGPFAGWTVNAGSGRFLGSSNSGYAGVRFKTNGIADELVNGLVDDSFNWVTPTTANDELFEVRMTNLSWILGEAGGWQSKAADEDVWVTITGSTKEWALADSNSGPGGSQELTCQFQIRYNGGSVLASSGLYTLQVDYDTQ
jgi:hypothetical protein